MSDNDLIRRGDVLAKTSAAVFDFQAADVVFVSDIAKIPTVDAVEVVRCCDCKYRQGAFLSVGFEDWRAWCPSLGKYVRQEFYCADGERNTKGE